MIEYSLIKEIKMINDFSSFVEAYKKKPNQTLKNLSSKEIETLKGEIEKWEPINFSQVNKVLEQSGIEVTDRVAKEMCLEDLGFAYELYEGRLDDTYGRELTREMLTKVMGLQEWPKISQGDQVFEDFMKKLAEVAPAYGVKVNQKDSDKPKTPKIK